MTDFNKLQKNECDKYSSKNSENIEEYLEQTLGENLELADPDICPDCLPNNFYVEPDISVHEGVYYDEKNCDYVVVFTGPDSVRKINQDLRFDSIEEYIKNHEITNSIVENDETVKIKETVLSFGLKKITLEYNKTQQNEFYNINSTTTTEPLEAVARFDYLIDPTNERNSLIKIRIRVSKRIIDSLPEERSGQEDDEIQSGIDMIEIDAVKFYGMILRLSYGLRIYSSYYSLHILKSNGYLYKKGDKTKSPIPSNKIWSTNNNHVTLESELKNFREKLTNRIKEKNYRINFFQSSTPWDNKKIEKIKILFDNSDPENLYKIKRISVKPYGCRYRPIVREKQALLFNSGFKYFNVMALIANLNDIDDDLRAIEPPTWHEFLQKYLVPAVALEYGNETGIVTDQNSALACSLDYFDPNKFIQNALYNLESIFGLLSFETNKAACEATQGKLNDKNNLSADVTLRESWSKYYNSGDSFILEIYKRLSNIGDGNYGKGQGINRIINALTFCEVTNLFKKIIECLLRGKPFEEVVPLIVNRLMKDLSMRHLGKLLTSLPPDQRAEVTREVSNILGQPAPEPWSDSWAEGGSADIKAASTLDFSTDSNGQIKQTPTQTKDLLTKQEKLIEDTKSQIEKNENRIAQEDRINEYGSALQVEKLKEIKEENVRLKNNLSAYEARRDAIQQEVDQNEDIEGYTFGFVSDQANTSTQQQLKQMNFDGKLSKVTQKIAGAYIEAFMKVIDPNDLLTYLDKLPASALIRNLLAIVFSRAYCPTPPLAAFGDLSQLIPKFKIDICDPTFAIKIPKLPRLPRITFDFKTILFKRIKQKIVDLLIKLLINIIIRIIKLIDDAICKGINALLEAPNDFLNFLGNSLCDDQDKKDPLESLNDAMQKAGLSPNDPTFQNQLAANCLASSIASVMTKREMMLASVGRLNTPGSFDKVSKSISVSCPELSEKFPNGDSIKSIFDVVSDYIPLDVKETIEDQLFQEPELENILERPVCDLLCLSNQDYDNWNKFRENILTDQGMTSEQAKEEVNKMNEHTSEILQDSLDDLASLQDKIRDAIADLYDDGDKKPPGCDQNGLSGGDEDDSNLKANSFESNKTMEDQSDEEMFVQTIESSFYANITGKRKSILSFILSDTNGKFYRYHQFLSKAFLFKDIVYNSQEDADADEFRFNFIEPEGFFPKTIGAHCRNSMLNSFQEEEIYKKQNTINTFTPVITKKKGVEIEKTRPPNKKFDFKFSYKEEDEDDIKTFFINSYNENDNSYVEKENFGFTIITMDSKGKEILLNEKTDNSYLGDYFANLNSGTEPYNFAAFKKFFEDKVKFNTGFNLIYNELQSFYFKFATIAILSKDIDLSTNELLPDFDREIKKKDVSDRLEEFENFSQQSSAGFNFGYSSSDISEEDLTYYNPDGVTEYDHDEEEEVLGTSSKPDKVIFLDPEIYGGKYSKPKIYISPEPQSGWLKIFNAMSKSNKICDDYVDIVFPFKNYRDRLRKLKNQIPFDKRLYEDRNCFPDVPFDTILPPEIHSFIDFICRSSLLTYSISEIFKMIPILSNLHFNETNYSNLVPSIILKKIKNEMFNSIGPAATKNNKYLRRHRHWLIFLEQCVQIFEREVRTKSIVPTNEEKAILEKILMVKKYYYDPTLDDISILRDQDDLTIVLGDSYRDFVLNQDTDKFDFYKLAIGYDEFNELCYLATIDQNKKINKPKRIRINKFKLQTRLFAIRSVEEDILVLVKRLLNQEIKRFFDVFNKQIEPPIFDLYKYLFSKNKMFIGSNLNIGSYQEIKNLSNNFSHNYGSIEEIEPSLEESFINNLELDDARLEDLRKFGGFLIQKYMRINEKNTPIETKPESFSERDYTHRNVTTIQKIKEILKKSDINKQLKISDYFGNLEIINNELQGEFPIHMGIRIVYVASEALAEKFKEKEEFNNFLEHEQEIKKEKSIYVNQNEDNYNFQFTLISHEIPLQDQKISDFLDQKQHYDDECLIKAILESEECKILFKHIFSPKYVSSTVLSQTYYTFLSSIGYNDGWALKSRNVKDPEDRMDEYDVILKDTKRLLQKNLTSLVRTRDEDLEKDSRKEMSLSLLGFLKDLSPKFDFTANLSFRNLRRIVPELDDCDERLLDQFFPDEE